MTIARAHLVDASLTRWYYRVTRCVRRTFFLGEGDHNRKEWSSRTRMKDEVTRGFAGADNRMNVLVRGPSNKGVRRRQGAPTDSGKRGVAL
jgi:hypothetical protein